jgi:hypothetical protein
MSEIKRDCFGFDERCGQCKIMQDLICRRRNCTFYKTWEQYMADLDRHPAKEKEND